MLNWVTNDSSTRDESPKATVPEFHDSEQTTEALTNDQNKFIHLDPIPNFKDRSEIKPWLQKIFYPQGIEIVIERSDNIKVVFKCKAAKRGKNTRASESPHEQFNVPSEPPVDLKTIKKKKKRSVSRFNTCPFRIRATYSLKRKKWSIVVVNNCHSHPLKFNPDSEEYKKFKEKMRQDEDWEAIKKFDELEYRTRSNLPIESSLITCECGLTEEISSFNIVLPSTKHTSSNTLVKKPKSNSKLREQRKETFFKISAQQEHLPNTTHVDSPSISGFIDDPSDNQFFIAPTGTTDNSLTDLNEIDFTNIFNRFHQNPSPNRPRLQHRQSATEGHLNMFSPVTMSTFQYYSPSDDPLQSPAQMAPPASSTHNSTHNALGFSMKPFSNFPSADPFTPPVCELNNSNVCQEQLSDSYLNSKSSNALASELDQMKTMTDELQMLNDTFSPELFTQQQQPQPFRVESPWAVHASTVCTPSVDSTTADYEKDNERNETTDKSLWEINFGSP